MKNVVQEQEKLIVGTIKVDEKEIKEHLNGIARQSVEETLNSLLNAETDGIPPKKKRCPDSSASDNGRTNMVSFLSVRDSKTMLTGSRMSSPNAP